MKIQSAPPVNKKLPCYTDTFNAEKQYYCSKKPVTKPATNLTKSTPKTTKPLQKEDPSNTIQPPVTGNWKQDATITTRKPDTPIVKWEQPNPLKGPIPKVLLERENNLIKTIYTNEQVATVEIFDNGTIDNDTISLYHNNKLVISQAKLTYTPLRLKIDCSGDNKRHELIMVAENLGEIPPNSALMVITAGKKRYEVFLISNEQRNAKVVIEYTPE